MSEPNMFATEEGGVLYLRDVNRLNGTRAQLKRRELSGEIIHDPRKLKTCLGEKLAMQSKNVTKAFRKLDTDYSGTLDRTEFRHFLENLNMHTTHSCYDQVRRRGSREGGVEQRDRPTPPASST